MALPKLKQGSTLSIRSQIKTNVVLQPEWRDTGHASLEQIIPRHQTASKQPLVNMTVKVKQDRMTSIGRVAPDISIDLVPLESNTFVSSTNQSQKDNSYATSHTPSKQVDKVILDDGTILPDSDQFSPPPKGSRRVEYHDGIAHIHSDEHDVDAKTATETTLTLQIPEKLNLLCDLSPHGGSISITGKVEGDAELITANGDISVTKLRGHKIHLEQHQREYESKSSTSSNDSSIYASNLLEAMQLTVKTCGRVRAKQVHGTHVQIELGDESSAEQPTSSYEKKNNSNEESTLPKALDTDDEGSLVDIGALFVSGNGGATIDVKNHRHLTRRAVRVKSHHGPLRVSTSNVSIPTETCSLTGKLYPMVELGGVNGNCEVEIKDTTTTTTRPTEKSNWISCLIHLDSLLPETISVVAADCGNISLTLDRKIEADLRLLSTKYGDELAASATLLAEEEDDNMIMDVLGHLGDNKSDNASLSSSRNISIETTAFTMGSKSFQSEGVEYVQGIVTNKSAEPDSRFDRKIHGDTSAGAGIGKINLKGAANQALDRFSDSATQSSNEKEADNALRPLMAVVGRQGILVESVSWLGAIARRYGLEETVRDSGRTAARRGRSYEPAPNVISER